MRPNSVIMHDSATATATDQGSWQMDWVPAQEMGLERVFGNCGSLRSPDYIWIRYGISLNKCGSGRNGLESKGCSVPLEGPPVAEKPASRSQRVPAVQMGIPSVLCGIPGASGQSANQLGFPRTSSDGSPLTSWCPRTGPATLFGGLRTQRFHGTQGPLDL